VQSVTDIFRRYVGFRKEAAGLYGRYGAIETEVNRAIEIGTEHTEYAAFREELYRHYAGGDYVVYGQSQANEVVAKGIAAFVFSKGNPREAVIDAVNLGRDTDCAAAVAGGLAGALSGPGELPAEWIRQVNDATVQDPYTNNKRSAEQTAQGLFDAYCARRAAMQSYLDTMNARGFLA